MRKLGVVLAVAFVLVAAVGIGQHALALTECDDSIVGPNCNYVGEYMKGCCLMNQEGRYQIWQSYTSKWMKGTSTYWTDPSFEGNWSAYCTPDFPRTCS